MYLMDLYQNLMQLKPGKNPSSDVRTWSTVQIWGDLPISVRSIDKSVVSINLLIILSFWYNLSVGFVIWLKGKIGILVISRKIFPIFYLSGWLLLQNSFVVVKEDWCVWKYLGRQSSAIVIEHLLCFIQTIPIFLFEGSIVTYVISKMVDFNPSFPNRLFDL